MKSMYVCMFTFFMDGRLGLNKIKGGQKKEFCSGFGQRRCTQTLHLLEAELVLSRKNFWHAAELALSRKNFWHAAELVLSRKNIWHAS